MIEFYELRLNEQSRLHCRIKLDSIKNANNLTSHCLLNHFDPTKFSYPGEYIHYVSDDDKVMSNFIELILKFDNNANPDMRTYFEMKLREISPQIIKETLQSEQDSSGMDIVDSALAIGKNTLLIVNHVPQTEFKPHDNSDTPRLRRSSRSNSFS